MQEWKGAVSLSAMARAATPHPIAKIGIIPAMFLHEINLFIFCAFTCRMYVCHTEQSMP
jgi:hypothetical protein